MDVHGRAGKPKQLARNAKNPGKIRVLQRRGQEPNFWVFSNVFEEFERDRTDAFANNQTDH
ncbi:MAG: hypothetical protein DWH99_02495 [Planctomycetota bacterium]|nr:MAG: hypothetical protein DWH99_02495 [Planctomycetota bacterium]